ncbi:hypothetical protein ASG17_12760 [Brevundimonas sp. Leaf363]|nr:hypothetical protein ASG17_12760 [Brevundimonas sp. Leaf363]
MQRMGPYTLSVFRRGEPAPTETAHAARAVDVLRLIKELRERHSDCHRIRVSMVNTPLFAVDCNGETVDD